jgi:hypothetical protein
MIQTIPLLKLAKGAGQHKNRLFTKRGAVVNKPRILRNPVDIGAVRKNGSRILARTLRAASRK